MSSQAELIDKRQRKICAAREKIRLVENSLKTVIVTALCGVLYTHDALGDLYFDTLGDLYFDTENQNIVF